jgi:hypothetical protein
MSEGSSDLRTTQSNYCLSTFAPDSCRINQMGFLDHHTSHLPSGFPYQLVVDSSKRANLFICMRSI